MKSGKNIFGNITVGMQLGLTVAAFVYAGYWLDLRYDKTPLFLSVGAIVGMIIGFYHMIKELGRLNPKKTDDRPVENKGKKTRWM